MKFLPPFLFLLISPLVGFGQSYTPFPTDTAYWVWNLESFPWMGTPSSKTVSHWLMGDTILMNRHYYIIVDNSSFNGTTFLREDSTKKIWVSFDGQTEHVLYDFNIAIGDTVSVLGPHGPGLLLKLTDTNSVQSLTGARTSYVLEEVNGGWGIGDHIWIEGIGSMRGLLYSLIPWTHHDGQHICFGTPGQGIFPDNCPSEYPVGILNSSADSTFNFYPNPATDYIFIPELRPNDNLFIGGIDGKLYISTSANKVIDIKDLPDGVYVIILHSDTRMARSKFVKVSH